MIRLLFGSALPVLGLGFAAAILGPSLVTGPRGEPIIMAGADRATLQAASYDGEACSSALLFAGPVGADDTAGAHVVAFALRSGERGVVVEVEDFPGGTNPPMTVALVFDDAGRLIAAGDPESLQLGAAAKVGPDCIDPAETTPRAPI
jgi:hypothetical protein